MKNKKRGVKKFGRTKSSKSGMNEDPTPSSSKKLSHEPLRPRSATYSSPSNSSMTSSSASKSSFFASFTPRWGRSQSYQNTASSGLTPADKSVKERHAKEQEQNKEKIKLWLKEQAQKLYDAYFSDNAVGKSHPALNMLHRLTEASEKLNIENDCGTEPLNEICDVLSEPSDSGASPFEIVHSIMVKQLPKY